METALIITSTKNKFTLLTELLREHSAIETIHVQSCSHGRRLLLERFFDIVIVNSPLPDETGESLARQIALNESSQVILIVKSENYEQVSAVCEKDGVLTIAEPINKELFRQALSLVKSIRTRLMIVKSENDSLKLKIDNIRIIDRAKNILISSCRMSEHEAHRHIEKMAMDTRCSKRDVSEKIINDYENGPETTVQTRRTLVRKIRTESSHFPSRINEKCAVLGVSLLNDEAFGVTYNGLLTLQHRGQESAGIAVVSEGNIICKKDTGLVSEVFAKENFSSFPSSRTAIGHTRYSTTGGSQRENAGPFVTEYLTGRIATAHNGNITNARDLRMMLESYGLRFKSTCDSEVVASLLAYRIVKEKEIMKGIERAVSELEGAFSLCIATADGLLFAVRDTCGFRPLCLGKNQDGIIIASESCAFDACGFEFLRDVKPGEIVIIENGKIINSIFINRKGNKNLGLCVFEYVYFARPDSVIDGLSVYEARFNMGKILAEEHPAEADIVCGVPDSGLDAAIGYASESSLPLVNGFVKNRYIGRSFIYPTQNMRLSAVRLKLNPLRAGIEGKRVVLVDDSIVRGTTIEKIVRSLKAAGAKEVHLRISSPPFIYTCRYGTDINNVEALIAYRMSLEEICREIGADSLGYISIEGLKRSCNKCAVSLCSVCFTGNDENPIANNLNY